MVNLDCVRKQGKYDLDTLIDIEKDNIIRYTIGHDIVIYEENDKRYYIKFTDVDNYRQSAELLYSAFSNSNGLACAEVDVAMIKNKEAIISQDVYYKGLVNKGLRIDGFELIQKAGYGSFNLHYYVSVEYMLKALKKFSKMNNIPLDKNIETDLLKLVIMDYLAVHEDRHTRNILFIEDVETKTLKLAPAFDNEFGFGLRPLSAWFSCLPKLIALGAADTSLEQITDYIDGEDFERLSFLGVKDHDFLDDEDFFDNAEENLIQELAQKIEESSELKEFYKNFKFNAKHEAEKIKTQTGFTILTYVYELAQKLFNNRKMRLDKALERLQQDEPMAK